MTTTLPREQAPAGTAGETPAAHARRSGPDGGREQPRAGGRSRYEPARQRRAHGGGTGGVRADASPAGAAQQQPHAAGEPVLRRSRASRPTSGPATPASSSSCRGAAAATTFGFDSSQRTTTNNPFTSFNPSLTSALQAIFSQPLLRDFKIDPARAQVEIEQRNRDIADIQLRERGAQVAGQRGSAPTGRWWRRWRRSTSSSGRSTSRWSSSAPTARGSTSASRRRSISSRRAPRWRSGART